MTLAFDRLPPVTRVKVDHMASRVVPRIEFNGIDSKDAISFIVAKPKPKHMIRLGLVSDRQEREPDPVWLDDLQLDDKKLSCIFTKASLLDLSVLLAESLDCEFGVDSTGEAVFRNKTKQAKIKHPAYILRRILFSFESNDSVEGFANGLLVARLSSGGFKLQSVVSSWYLHLFSFSVCFIGRI